MRKNKKTKNEAVQCNEHPHTRNMCPIELYHRIKEKKSSLARVGSSEERTEVSEATGGQEQ